MIRMQDFGEIAYGGAVTLTEWWDNKRVEEGKLAKKDILKKASFYTYLGVGLPATLMSAFGWWRPAEKWMEHISHGFLYDMPRFIMNVVQSMGTASRATRSDAVRQAQEILRQRQLTAGKSAAVPTGVPMTSPSYSEELAIIGSVT